MSEQAPEGRRPGGGRGGGLNRQLGGVPVWAWGLLGVVAVGGVYYLIRHRQNATTASSTSTGGGCTDANGNPVDCGSITAVAGGDTMAQYEQLTAQLTGLSGQDAAILAAIRDSQGHDHDDDSGMQGGRVTVPDVMGVDTDQAENIIQKAGLNPQVSGHDDNTVVSGEIPPANTRVREGSTVILATKAKSGRRTGGGGSPPPTKGDNGTVASTGPSGVRAGGTPRKSPGKAKAA